ncbi:unnamed protein product [Zymoseptoria tritici ST99CH_3D7]|uniref:Uncharacterized protein n=3 Tax=Zymoseptoria tritici TaxID=1047171 RepID=A0A1X7RTH2_ZYMT9|nr:unnamed protein product [Zymoseptoria tritici ST99CH_3D7]
MLPTHKKRMMQEQWEREGKTGTAYDRDLRLLNDEEIQPPKAALFPPEQREDPPNRHSTRSPPKLSLTPNLSQNAGWSNAPLSPRKSESGSTRPTTSGGYRITPNVTTPPPMQRMSTMASTAHGDKPVPRLPEMDEKDEAKPKKACCCVVM